MNVGVRGLPGLRRETWGTRRLQLVETGTIRFEVYTHSPEKQEAGSLRQVQGRLSTPLRFAQNDIKDVARSIYAGRRNDAWQLAPDN